METISYIRGPRIHPQETDHRQPEGSRPWCARCGGGAGVARSWCARGALAVRVWCARCAGGAGVVRAWCGCGAVVVRARCARGAAARNPSKRCDLVGRNVRRPVPKMIPVVGEIVYPPTKIVHSQCVMWMNLKPTAGNTNTPCAHPQSHFSGKALTIRQRSLLPARAHQSFLKELDQGWHRSKDCSAKIRSFKLHKTTGLVYFSRLAWDPTTST